MHEIGAPGSGALDGAGAKGRGQLANRSSDQPAPAVPWREPRIRVTVKETALSYEFAEGGEYGTRAFLNHSGGDITDLGPPGRALDELQLGSRRQSTRTW